MTVFVYIGIAAREIRSELGESETISRAALALLTILRYRIDSEMSVT